ncbi:MAG: GPR endopeptidase, partial [Clostridia bacterium]|nr:GPR endopeptidase [Clostridia bacterium]
VGNARATISSKTLGVPVIAVGVPTVVDAATLAYDILQGEKNEIDENAMRKALGHEVEQMMITPREIDLLIERASRLIAMSINCALHPDISAEDILSLVG